MLNRQDRRAAARAERRADKRTHKLPPQACALWIPEARSYFAGWTEKGFLCVEDASGACIFCEHTVSGAALAFTERTGLRVVVRPCYLR